MKFKAGLTVVLIAGLSLTACEEKRDRGTGWKENKEYPAAQRNDWHRAACVKLPVKHYTPKSPASVLRQLHSAGEYAEKSNKREVRNIGFDLNAAVEGRFAAGNMRQVKEADKYVARRQSELKESCIKAYGKNIIK